MDNINRAKYCYTIYSGLRGGCCLSDAQIQADIASGTIEPVRMGKMQCYRYNPSEINKLYWDTVDCTN